jgi:hypothetical protein
MWSEPNKESGAVWRFVLLDSQTEKQHGFQSLEALVDFLSLLTQMRGTDEKVETKHEYKQITEGDPDIE